VIERDRVQGEHEVRIGLTERIGTAGRELFPEIDRLIRKGPVETRRQQVLVGFFVFDQTGERPHAVENRSRANSLRVGEGRILVEIGESGHDRILSRLGLG
jgi:hypothetical protein